MQKMYKGLENKIISLQQRIDELNKDNTKLKQRAAEIPELKTKLETHRAVEAELKAHRVQLVDKDAQLLKMAQQLDQERDEKMSLTVERERDRDLWEHSKQTWRIENDLLKTQVAEMIESASNQANGKWFDIVYGGLIYHNL